MPERPFTPAQLAEHWQCSERHVRNMIAAGKIEAFQIRPDVAYPGSGGQGEGGAMPEDVRLVRYRGVWAAAWQEGGRTKRRSLRTSDRGDAEQAIADWKRAAARKATTVGEIMALYLAEKDKTVSAPARLREAWKQLRPDFNNLRPDQIDRERCRDYVRRRREKGVGAGTIGKELGTLRAGLRWADPHTLAVIELPSLPPPRERYLTREEARRLIANAEAPHVKLFIMLALTTAGRKEAILELTWDRVDFDRGIIRLGLGERRTKGRATVPMHDLARPMLLEMHRAAVTDYVVEWGGRRLRSIRKGFAQACKRAQLRGVTPHVLRHTAAVWQAEAGVPMSEIAAYLGHSDTRITERVYARFSPDHLRRAASAIGW